MPNRHIMVELAIFKIRVRRVFIFAELETEALSAPVGQIFNKNYLQGRRVHLIFYLYSRYHRRPLKRRKLRRSTTERYPEDDEKNQPDYKKFCRQVIRTIAANADGDNFRKVSMYQEIYYKEK